MTLHLLILLSCADKAAESATACVAGEAPTAYQVERSFDPDPPIAGEEARWTARFSDQDGCAIQDLQTSHERIFHTLFISQDLSQFYHVHPEDEAPVTADELRSATWDLPLTFDRAGAYLNVVDYAHRNQWLQSSGMVYVGGTPEQGAPDLTINTSAEDRGVTGVLRWDIPAKVGFEAGWTLTLSDSAGEVSDLVQWLGADGHAAVVPADLSSAAHTHAWSPGIEAMTPTMKMPQVYTGPDLPFHYTFLDAGMWRMWVQFARSDAPDEPYVLAFNFEVSEF